MPPFHIFNDIRNFFKSINSKSKKKVLITGFGPFFELKINPSWEGLNAMKIKEIEEKYSIELRIEQIAVRYANVDLIVPELLDSFQPDLTIHVGANDGISNFVLETRARKRGYVTHDGELHYAAALQNPCDGPKFLFTSLDVTAISHEFGSGQSGDKLTVGISNNAGGYLCEYIYYTSLCDGRCPTLFVHVPVGTYTNEELAQGLERIMSLCLNQIKM